MTKQEPRYEATERVMHWIHAPVVVLLLLSGWYIFSPDTAPFFKGMASARLVHFVCMWIFLCVGIFHGYDYFVTGRFATDSFHSKDLKEVPYGRDSSSSPSRTAVLWAGSGRWRSSHTSARSSSQL